MISNQRNSKYFTQYLRNSPQFLIILNILPQYIVIFYFGSKLWCRELRNYCSPTGASA